MQVYMYVCVCAPVPSGCLKWLILMLSLVNFFLPLEYFSSVKGSMGFLFLPQASFKQWHKIPAVKILMFDHRVSYSKHVDILFVQAINSLFHVCLIWKFHFYLYLIICQLPLFGSSVSFECVFCGRFS